MKKIIRRIFLDIRKRTGSWILKIVVFTMLFSLFFTSISIQSISNQVNENILSHYNLTSGILSRDFAKWYQQKKEDYFNETKQYLQVFNELGKSEGVDFQDINFEAELYSSLYTLNMEKDPIEILGFGNSDFLELSFEEHDYIEYKNNIKCTENKRNYCVMPSIKTVQSPNFIDLNYQRLEIIEGRTFTEQELFDGANVCIVKENSLMIDGKSKQLVKVGDKIPISEIYYDAKGQPIRSKLHELEVIGLYHPTNGTNIVAEYEDYHIPVYIPEKLFEEYYISLMKYNRSMQSNFLNTTTNNETYRIYQGIFGFNTLDHLRIFLDDLENNEDYFKNDYSYFSTADQYYVSISNVLSVSQSFELVSKLCFVICMMITIMMIIFDIMKRKKEMGILLSLGSQVKEVVIQYVIELFLIMVISFTLALFLSIKITALGNQFLFQSSLDSISSLMNSISSLNLPSLMENVNQDVIVDLNNTQLTTNNLQLLISYIGCLFGIEVVVCWYFIRRIDPIELLKDE